MGNHAYLHMDLHANPVEAFEREVQKSPDKSKWGEEELAQQYHNMGIELIKSRGKAIRDYWARRHMEKH